MEREGRAGHNEEMFHSYHSQYNNKWKKEQFAAHQKNLEILEVICRKKEKGHFFHLIGSEKLVFAEGGVSGVREFVSWK